MMKIPIDDAALWKPNYFTRNPDAKGPANSPNPAHTLNLYYEINNYSAEAIRVESSAVLK